MRIIAGTYRGKKLYSPNSDKVRPTSDRAREAVFNILNSMLENPWSEYSVLDVFSGSGALALEALSRGAKQVCLVDVDVSSLSKNIALFPHEKNQIKIVKSDIKKLPQTSDKYNLLFMDAPYNQGLSEIALQNLAQQCWLQKNTLCVVEIEKTEQISIPNGYKLIDERIYGLAKIMFLCYEKDIYAK